MNTLAVQLHRASLWASLWTLSLVRYNMIFQFSDRWGAHVITMHSYESRITSERLCLETKVGKTTWPEVNPQWISGLRAAAAPLCITGAFKTLRCSVTVLKILTAGPEQRIPLSEVKRVLDWIRLQKLDTERLKCLMFFCSDVKQIQGIRSCQRGVQPEMELCKNTHLSPQRYFPLRQNMCVCVCVLDRAG